jgi:hypothetical protein
MIMHTFANNDPDLVHMPTPTILYSLFSEMNALIHIEPVQVYRTVRLDFVILVVDPLCRPLIVHIFLSLMLLTSQA